MNGPETIAFWINMYYAGALRAARAPADGLDSVLRVQGAFHRPFVTVAGEHLSLNAVEHAKLQRLGNPRSRLVDRGNGSPHRIRRVSMGARM